MGTSHCAEHSTNSADSNSSVSEYAGKARLCRCGCGGELPRFGDHVSRAIRYLPGHFDRSILQNFDLDPDTDCWIWRGKPTAAGHGQINRNGITVTAHRFIYNALVGDPGPDITVHHTCPNRLCINPDHQEERLHSDHRRHHALDKWARQKAEPGQRLIGLEGTYTRVSEDDRAEICRLCQGRVATQQELAVRFGISRRTVQTIVAKGQEAAL